ncbi:MAG: hypothetical protein DCC66_01700 [Planctomycetota bacterium]|nr:MAG: hypothetical protein DCC66_01700 [Planctomycetota bacterium]
MPATIPSTREGLGLVPNSSDKIKPLIWITRHDAANQGYYSKEDELDLFIAAELEWLMPFESDSELLNAIGAENISYHPVDVSDSSRTRPVLIRFEGIRLGVAIKLLSELGATEVTHNGGSTSRVGSRIMLNDSVEEYSAALVYEGENHLSTIELE